MEVSVKKNAAFIALLVFGTLAFFALAFGEGSNCGSKISKELCTHLSNSIDQDSIRFYINYPTKFKHVESCRSFGPD